MKLIMVIVNPYIHPFIKSFLIFFSLKTIKEIISIDKIQIPIIGCIQINKVEKKPDNLK